MTSLAQKKVALLLGKSLHRGGVGRNDEVQGARSHDMGCAIAGGSSRQAGSCWAAHSKPCGPAHLAVQVDSELTLVGAAPARRMGSTSLLD